MAVRPICPNCRNFISEGNKPLFTKCKAFLYGVPRPYGDNPSPYYPSDSEEPEISIRKHRIFTPIQENDYVYESIKKDESQSSPRNEEYLMDVIYSIFLHHIIPLKPSEVDEDFKELLKSNPLTEDEATENVIASFGDMVKSKSSNEIRDWMKQWNQSKKAKYLLDLYPTMEVKDWLGVVKNMGIPEDFYLGNGFGGNGMLENIDTCLLIGLIQPFKFKEELDLQNKGLQELPGHIGGLKQIRFLYLSNNQLTGIPHIIGEFLLLERLDLFGNQLKTLPDSVCALLNLNRLDLYQNQLEALPIEIGNLINLKSLGLNQNQLSVLPDSLANLQTLEGLYLTDNQFMAIPPPITKLENLKYLYLSRNQLKEVPNGINNLKNLCWLGLAGNQLSTLPDSIGELQRLEWLDLRENPISEAEQVRIKGLLPQVEILFH